MTAPTWAVESCDADSTDDTEIVDHYGVETHFPHSGMIVQQVQRETTRDGVTLHDPIKLRIYLESTDPENAYFVWRDLDFNEIPAIVQRLSQDFCENVERSWTPTA